MAIHGGLQTTPAGRDLLVTRSVPIGVEELWRWVSESVHTEKWYGPWTGDAREGAVIDITMTAEEGAPTSQMRILESHRPRSATDNGRLRLASVAEPPFDWVVGLELTPRPTGSAVSLRHVSIPDDVPLADLGAGWEFYLDALVAAIEGREGRTFEQCVAEFGPGYAAL